MRFPRNIAGIDVRRSEELVLRAIDGGVNFFDTAWLYPGNEEALGTILRRNGAREKVFVQTKLPLLMIKGPDDFDRHFNQSLQRLKTDYVDYYLMHMITDMNLWEKLKGWGVEKWIAEKKKEGRIRHAGFSFHGGYDEFAKVVADYDWEACLIQYNYFDENFQAGVRGLRMAAGTMPVFVMEPLLGGKLATALPKDAVAIFKKADPKLSPAAWGLNWVWNQGEATLLLSGMSNPAQLEENLALADAAEVGMHGGAELEVYARALAVIKEKYKIRCTGCGYCIPCPRGVNIPACFSAYNTMHSIGYRAGMWQFITSTGFMSESSASPSRCTACGKCERHCPQQLPVIADLAEVGKRMEPWWLRLAGASARAFLGRKRVQG